MMKRGQTSTTVITGLIIFVVALIVAFYFIYRAHLTGLSDQQICHQSVVLAATGKGITPLNCKTDYVCISGGGKCANMTATVTVNVDPTNKDQIMKAIADQMANCWYTYGEGKLDYLGLSKGAGGGAQCAVCSVIGFDSSVQTTLSKISSPSGSSQFSSTATETLYNQVSNNDAYSSLFDTYSKEYQPKDLSQNYFKTLLLSVAYQSGWGSPAGSGNWILGYRVNDKSYQTPEEQISAVSQILQGAIDNNGGNGVYQSGATTGNYAKCDSASAIDEKVSCILSVYYTGELPSQWKAEHTPIVGGIIHWGEKFLGINKNVKGDNYAAEVLFNWNAIKGYVQQSASAGTNSNVNPNTNTPSYPLSYKDLINYLAANKVTEDNQLQTYMSFLYGVSSVAQLLTVSQDKKDLTTFYNTQSISLDGQYAVITGEGKSALWGTFGSDYLRPVLLNTNDVATYLGAYCPSYVTYS